MGHLDSQRSLPAFGGGTPAVSSTARKLRLSEGQSVAVLNSPDGYLDSLRPAPVEIQTAIDPATRYDVVQLFARTVDELRRLGPAAIAATRDGGLLWLTFPRERPVAGATDPPASPWWMGRDVLGEIAAETGFKPVALVAVGASWTALRFKRV